MRAHIVLAHPEAGSYNAHLARSARETLQSKGWSTTMTDLYATGFDPAERPTHYGLTGTQRFDIQAAQKIAGEASQLPAEIKAEIAACDAADLLILQYPMWWHLPPAMMKGWFDRVLAYGEVYASGKRFQTGRFAGKKAMVSVTVGTSRPTYEYNGRSGDIDLLLWPVLVNLAYVGYEVLSPFVSYGVEGALRYSAENELAERLRDNVDKLRAYLSNLDAVPILPFNPTTDWTPEGRISEAAPAYSPFMRHRKDLDLG